MIKLCFAEPPFIPSPIKKVIAADAVAHRDFNKKIWEDMFGHLTRETASAKENLLKPYLPQIQAPVLIIWGDSDKILDVGGVSLLEKNLRNYHTVIMINTGHIPMLEKPRDTALHYIGFLKGKSKADQDGSMNLKSQTLPLIQGQWRYRHD